MPFSLTGDFSVVSRALTNLPLLISSWGFGLGTAGEEEGVKFIQEVRTVLQKGEESGEIERKLVSEYLITVSDGVTSSGSSSPPVTELAKDLVLLSLSSANVFEFSAVSLIPSVKSLAFSSDANKRDIYTLLSIFHSGSLSDLQSLASKNPPLLSSNGLSEADLKRKLQLLTLADLCSEHIGENVSYSQVQDQLALDVSEEDFSEEVESWIIMAIHHRLLSARLHEPSSSFFVQSSTSRTFSRDHWRRLQEKLMGWRAGLDAILETTSGLSRTAAIESGNAVASDTNQDESNGVPVAISV